MMNELWELKNICEPQEIFFVFFSKS
ncbi:hypothetical protein [Mycoplasmopsis bovis]